jgi:Uma2 family endonuclease
MPTEITRKLFTVDEFYSMFDAGILHRDSRLELIEGEIFEMTGPGPLHVACVNRATAVLTPALVGKAIVSIQNPLRLSNYSEPQPDIVLLKPRKDYYASERFSPEDTFMVMEVSDTSFLHDLNRKLPLYARAGVPEVWIEDLAGGMILVYRDRRGENYETSLIFHRGDSISPAAFPEAAFRVDDLIGPAQGCC